MVQFLLKSLEATFRQEATKKIIVDAKYQPTTMLPSQPRGRPPHHHNNAPSTTSPPSPQQPATEPAIWIPQGVGTVDQSSGYEQAVLQMISDSRPQSTKNCFDNKITEYYEYASLIYSTDPFHNILCPVKVFKFMFYQAMRSPKRRGGKKPSNRATGHQKFNVNDYDSVMTRYSKWFDNPTSSPFLPENACSERTFAQYKTSMRWIYKDQTARKVCALTWDQIWTLALHNLHTLVRRRQTTMKKENCDEKIAAVFAPFTAVAEFPLIEKQFWIEGSRSVRASAAWLRHRFCFLLTSMGILCCESLLKADLSDFFGLKFKKTTDIHQIFLLIFQIPLGK